MNFKKIIIFILIYLIFINQVIAGILFSEIFPNTDDDTILEYIELYNSGSLVESLSGYILKDKSGKEFLFGSGDYLGNGETKKYFRNDTKILLNNSDEDLFLYDNLGNLIDTFSYTGSVKGEVFKMLNLEENILPEIGEETTSPQPGEETTSPQPGEETTSPQPGEEITSPQPSPSGGEGVDTSSGIISETNSGNLIFDSGSVDEFKLKFSFQNPSYILDKEIISEKYICDNSENECKINLDLRDSFTGSFLEKDYECKINFGFTGWLNGEENKCNPSTVIFPKGSFDIKFEIVDKSNSGNIFTGGFLLENKVKEKIIEVEKEVIRYRNEYIEKVVYRNLNESENNTSPQPSPAGEVVAISVNEKIEILKPEIKIQSGLDENNNCKNEVCKINLIYEEKNKNEKCIWDFSGGKYSVLTELKCNPGYVEYQKGNYEIKLKVYQDGNENNFKESILEFSNLDKVEEVKKDEDETKSPELNSEKITSLKTGEENTSPQPSPLGGEGVGQIKNIEFFRIMPNPSGSDELEFIEIKNNVDEDFKLDGCYLDDEIEGGSKKYFFDKNDLIKKGEIKKYEKSLTNINLNNKNDEVNLFCDNILVDKLKWDFSVKQGYYLDHSRLDINGGNAKVLDVIDGDTIKVEFLDSGIIEKLRLIGVDTPETKHPNKEIEKYGIEAYEFTKNNLLGKTILIEIDKNNFRDNYSRLLGYVFLDGNNFNKILIEKGYAKAYLNYDFKYELDFQKSEKQAKKDLIGIWKNTDLKKEIISLVDTDEKNVDKMNIDEENINEEKFEKELLNNTGTTELENENFLLENNNIFLDKLKNNSGLLLNVNNLNSKELNINTEKYSDEIKIDNIIKPVISLQGKLGLNKKVTGNSITCIDTCSINFDGSKSEGEIEKYYWDFGNGEKYEGKNPGYVKYEYFGKYKVELNTLSSNGTKSFESFYVEYIPKTKKEKVPKEKKVSTKKTENKSIKEISQSGSFSEGINKDDVVLNYEKNSMEYLLYILIILFGLNLIVLLLKREKLI